MFNSIEKLRKSFYVDNCVTSVSTEEELHRFRDEATRIMASGSFDLRCWEHSSCEKPSRYASVLGLTWDKIDDTLMVKEVTINEALPEKVTKRVILAASHKVFDPIGFSCPVLLRPKLLLQTITALDWDTEVDEETKKHFVEWHQQLHILENLRIPRRIFDGNKEKSTVSFHVFVDASQFAYATVIYARSQSLDGVKVQLVAAKSRVAPSKKTTIPRLELLGATIGTRLVKFIIETLECEEADIYYWCDSTTVLSWIHNQKQWATFVWNRVQEIRKLSNPDRWRHIPGALNPADLPSRGCTCKQLLESQWWEGPSWLKSAVDEWPTKDYVANDEEVNSELKKSVLKKGRPAKENLTISGINQTSPKLVLSWYTTYFSDYVKIIRMVAWMQRFINNSKIEKELIMLRIHGELSFQEFSMAELLILKLVQQESFTGDNDPRIICLKAFTDKLGLIRLSTLISNRHDNREFREPIVLDPCHLLVTRLIEHLYIKLQHAGVQIVMNALRERFWILTCRKAVRQVINKCLACKRYKVTHLESAPAILPEERVRDAAIFQVSGVDLTGPVYLRNRQKAWICLFTCAVFRAVHLELIGSLSTAAFIEALRRFISRRGRPFIIYSDNALNFTGTNNLLRKINWSEIQRISTVEKINWRHNPPSAAWWGGWWERLIRILKELLRRVLKKSCLSYEEMTTTLCDCESVINSRPITYLSDDILEPTPLTPAMFLQDIKESGVPDLDQIERCNLKGRYKYRQKLKEDLRQRFRIEYLGQLSRKHPLKQNKSQIQVGDVVLIENDTKKRLDWPLAKVLEVIAGRDNKVRVVRLKTAGGELVRPIQRVFPLELDSSPDQVLNFKKQLMK